MEALHAIDWSRWGLFGMGVLMVLVGCGPATAQATTPLIASGAALGAAALVFPRVRKLEIGGFVKAEIDSDEAAYRRLRVDVRKLRRFAWLVCGDDLEARELVEEALAETQLARRHGDRDAYALRSLAVLLENAREHALLRMPTMRRAPRDSDRRHELGEDFTDAQLRPKMEALAGLPMRVRLSYLLCCSWDLPVAEVVEIFASSPEEVREAVARGRQVLQVAPA